MLELLERFKATATQYSEGGTVPCPVRGQDVELDNCFGCARLEGVKRVDGVFEVRCKVSGRPAL